MLLILRREGESLYIGSDIEVKVTSISKSRVMLGITAPREISIRRSHPRNQGERLEKEKTPSEVAGPSSAGKDTAGE